MVTSDKRSCCFVLYTSLTHTLSLTHTQSPPKPHKSAVPYPSPSVLPLPPDPGVTLKGKVCVCVSSFMLTSDTATAESS